MNPLLTDLTASVDAIADPEHKQVARAMVILVSSLEVGADIPRLAHQTGFPTKFIQHIADNMTRAGLWIGAIVDDSEWWNGRGELDGVVLFAHAQVALGLLM